ncbi:PREDICTED: small cell adhesion glycoprotein isoform X1 [Cyprinodon variegatus]|uniref:small cell adhesion glycoprotein isoform X1 n=2 Tax=Cyprinodon variegatus TaxID=28743 RepID=UPI000742BDE3|nr:PREDICTED: small cell adhesion glycoprotein isoform X1 [Cyprinodon variegatus]
MNSSQTDPPFTMNSTDLNSTIMLTDKTMMRNSAVESTSFPPADTTVFQVVTTVAPASSDSALIAVVIVIILLTFAVFAFLLYRYLCHNKGDYRTTGELAPGEDPDEDFGNQAASEKKEYFI